MFHSNIDLRSDPSMVLHGHAADRGIMMREAQEMLRCFWGSSIVGAMWSVDRPRPRRDHGALRRCDGDVELLCAIAAIRARQAAGVDDMAHAYQRLRRLFVGVFRPSASTAQLDWDRIQADVAVLAAPLISGTQWWAGGLLRPVRTARLYALPSGTPAPTTMRTTWSYRCAASTSAMPTSSIPTRSSHASIEAARLNAGGALAVRRWRIISIYLRRSLPLRGEADSCSRSSMPIWISSMRATALRFGPWQPMRRAAERVHGHRAAPAAIRNVSRHARPRGCAAGWSAHPRAPIASRPAAALEPIR